ncbi:LYR-like [Tripterygium wilfordii]|uniref:LYR-like n=1 Tax=Tripterygium wilfordii TaxID=458696 RepID=A0A7J7BYK6_TRIWF|nr:LYR-like [Tripterygium wilfordii]
MASSGLANPTRSEILNLYRALLRTARQFCDYNIREYTKRRTVDAFRHNQNLTDSSSVFAAYSDGMAQLEVAKRQAIIYSMHAPKVKSVMEIKQAD